MSRQNTIPLDPCSPDDPGDSIHWRSVGISDKFNVRADPEGYRCYFLTGHHLTDLHMTRVLWDYDGITPGRITREWWRFVPSGPGGDGLYTGYYWPAKPGSRGATKVTIAENCTDYGENRYAS